MIIVMLLMMAVALYFLTTDRRYVLVVVVALLIELLSLSLMWLFSWPSMVGYISGMLMLFVVLCILLLLEDRKAQQQVKPSPIYLEHTPVYDGEQHAYFSQNLKDASS